MFFFFFFGYSTNKGILEFALPATKGCMREFRAISCYVPIRFNGPPLEPNNINNYGIEKDKSNIIYTNQEDKDNCMIK